MARGLVVLVSWGVFGGGAPSSARADEPELERSDPLVDDATAWEDPGFRFSLGYTYGLVYGTNRLPDANAHSLILRAGARLDADWSLIASLRYGFMGGDLEGLGYALTLDPTWHLGRYVEVAAGLGVGGLVGVSVSESQPTYDWPLIDYERTSSHTLPRSALPLYSCDTARGIAASARVAWRQVLDDIWSVAVVVEGQATRVECNLQEFSTDEVTGEVAALRQWWLLGRVDFGLELGWR